MVVETYHQGQSAAALGVDEEQRRDRENDLHGSVSQRGVERLRSCVPDLLENCGAVERDDCEHMISFYSQQQQ